MPSYFFEKDHYFCRQKKRKKMDGNLQISDKIIQASKQASITLKAETAGRIAWPSNSPWPVGA